MHKAIDSKFSVILITAIVLLLFILNMTLVYAADSTKIQSYRFSEKNNSAPLPSLAESMNNLLTESGLISNINDDHNTLQVRSSNILSNTIKLKISENFTRVCMFNDTGLIIRYNGGKKAFDLAHSINKSINKIFYYSSEIHLDNNLKIEGNAINLEIEVLCQPYVHLYPDLETNKFRIADAISKSIYDSLTGLPLLNQMAFEEFPELSYSMHRVPFDSSDFTILIIGLDKRCSVPLEGGLRSDEMRILAFIHGQAAFVSIPRDILINLTSHRKINGLYYWYGLDKLIEQLNISYGIKIDRYIVIQSLNYVKNVVDILGPINVNVTQSVFRNINLSLRYYCGENYFGFENKNYSFDAGMRQMNGTEAIAYLSARRSDVFRATKNQHIYSLIMQKLKTLKSPQKLLQMADLSREYLYSDLSYEELLLISTKFHFLKTQSLKYYVLSGYIANLYNPVFGENESYYVPTGGINEITEHSEINDDENSTELQ